MYRFFKFSSVAVLMVLVGLNFVSADPSKDGEMDYMKPYTGSAELEQMKSLSGTWTGTGIMHGQENPVTVEYKTTSNGTAVLETSFPGTPHEMVSVYYEEDGKLVMRHYCSLNNQPVMAMKNSSDNSIELDLVSATNMDASKDMHMHSLVITFVDDNNITQTWTPYKDGKPMEEATQITLTRSQ